MRLGWSRASWMFSNAGMHPYRCKAKASLVISPTRKVSLYLILEVLWRWPIVVQVVRWICSIEPVRIVVASKPVGGEYFELACPVDDRRLVCVNSDALHIFRFFAMLYYKCADFAARFPRFSKTLPVPVPEVEELRTFHVEFA